MTVPAPAPIVLVSSRADVALTGPETSAAKVLAILDAFRGGRGVLGVTEVASMVQVPKSTAHRLLSIMIDSGYIQKVGRRYGLTERSFEVGSRVGSGTASAVGLRRRAMPFLADVFTRTRETVHLGALSGTDVLYIEKLYGHAGAPAPTVVGARRPAHATALGKAMLAFADPRSLDAFGEGALPRFTPATAATRDDLERELERVRQDGFAVDRGELRPGISCIAVPVIDASTGMPTAAVSLCTFGGTGLSRHAATLRALAADLGRLLPAA